MNGWLGIFQLPKQTTVKNTAIVTVAGSNFDWMVESGWGGISFFAQYSQWPRHVAVTQVAEWSCNAKLLLPSNVLPLKADWPLHQFELEEPG